MKRYLVWFALEIEGCDYCRSIIEEISIGDENIIDDRPRNTVLIDKFLDIHYMCSDVCNNYTFVCKNVACDKDLELLEELRLNKESFMDVIARKFPDNICAIRKSFIQTIYVDRCWEIESIADEIDFSKPVV